MCEVDTTTSFGYAGGPCISPPEIVSKYARVEVRIDKDDIEKLLEQAGIDGFENGFDVEPDFVGYDKDEWGARFEIVSYDCEKHGGYYERLSV